MSYKRVVKKKGKSYGPYVYESYRDSDGKVKKRYLGKVEDKKKLSSSFIFLFCLLLIVGSYTTDFLVNDGSISKNVISKITGFSVEEGDFVESVSESVQVQEEDNDGPIIEEEQKVFEEVEEESDSSNVEQINLVDEEAVEEEIIVGGEIEETNETIIDEQNEIYEVINETLLEESNETEVNESSAVGGFSNETISNETFLNGTSINETLLEESNKTEINETVIIINETIVNETILNKTIINSTIVNETFNESVLQYKAVIGHPVRWIKKVDSNDLIVELPKDASNISVLTNDEVKKAVDEIDEYGEVVEKADRGDISKGILTGDVIFDLDKDKGILTKLLNWIKGLTISGNVILEEDIEGEITENKDSKVVDLTNLVSSGDEVAIEYYTEPPQANESFIDGGKRIVVHAPDEFNYTQILAFTLIDDSSLGLPMENPGFILYLYSSN